MSSVTLQSIYKKLVGHHTRSYPKTMTSTLFAPARHSLALHWRAIETSGGGRGCAEPGFGIASSVSIVFEQFRSFTPQICCKSPVSDTVRSYREETSR